MCIHRVVYQLYKYIITNSFIEKICYKYAKIPCSKNHQLKFQQVISTSMSLLLEAVEMEKLA